MATKLSSSDRALATGKAALAAPIQPGSQASKTVIPVSSPAVNASAKPSNYKGYTSAERNKLTDAQKAAIDNPQMATAANIVATIPGSVTSERNARLSLTEEQRNAAAGVTSENPITAQPSPYAAQIAPPNATPGTGDLNYEQAQANLNKGGLGGDALRMATDSLKARYGMGLATTNAQGTPVAESQGGALNTIAQNTPQAQEQYTPVPEVQSEIDKTLSVYSKAVADFLKPETQRTSLVQEYQQMSKQLGIPGLQAELLDVNRIMDGTEDDIRSEVTAASGFATDSQVQAMTIGRNKTLLKKAQYISDQLTAAKEQLTVLSNLNAQDKQFAQQRMSQGIAMLGNMVTIQQSMQKASQDNYHNIVNKVGYDGLAKMIGNDPFNTKLVEKTLGLAPGGLTQLAYLGQQERAKAEQERLLDLDIKRGQLDVQASNLLTDKYQRDNIQSQIDERNAAAIKEKNLQDFTSPPVINPQTGKVDPRSQLSSVINTTGIKSDDKLKLTGAVISAAQDLAERSKDGKFAGLGFGQIVPNRFASSEAQLNRTYLSGLKGTVESWMTGASVSEAQQKRIDDDMIPKTGDADWQVRNKINALTNYMMSFASGSLASQGVNFNPQNVDFFSNPVVAGDDGNEYEIVTN